MGLINEKTKSPEGKEDKPKNFSEDTDIEDAKRKT